MSISLVERKGMRILMLAAASSIHTVRWANALSDRGNEVHLAYCTNHEADANFPIKENVVLHRLNFPSPYGYYTNTHALKKLVKSILPGIINAHYASGYGTLARRAKLRPLILSVWGSDVYDFPYQSKAKHRLVVKNLEWAESIASTSKVMAKQVEQLGVHIKNPIAITPFGVDLQQFHYIERKNDNKARVVVGTVKTLAENYGIDILLRVFSKLSGGTDNKTLTLRIYGGGPQEQELKKMADDLGLSDSVEWQGAIPHGEIPDALAAMDIFACFSKLESFGVAVVEAMAAGLPVVTSNADGFKEVVDEGVTGFRAPFEEEDNLALLVKKLADDPELRTDMGRRSRERVEAFYDWEKNVDTMEALYRNLRLNSRRRF